MNRVFNFSAGPSALPLEVLEQAKAEFTDFRGIGASVMEISHRSKDFDAVAIEAEQDLRDLMNIPSNYKVLFMQGGGRGQFACVPMNLLSEDRNKADVLVTGCWSKYAYEEACKYGDIAKVEGTAIVDGIVKQVKPVSFRDDVDYVQYCANETVHGIELNEIPDVGGRTLVADISSNFLSKPIDVAKYGLLFAGAQKNVAPAGLTIVIVREDLLGHAKSYCPSIFDYKITADKDSMFNTPPVFCWYMAGLVFKWLKKLGGLEEMAKMNAKKAEYLYSYLDSTDFYNNNVDKSIRSVMNVPFFLKDESLNAKFLEESRAAGLMALKGHRILGGMRASIYNAVTFEAVESLVAFMDKFAKANS